MDEQKLQFRVGLFVLAALGLLGWSIVQFGELFNAWQETYAVAIQFDRAPGVSPGTPVRLNGILIGRTRKVMLDPAEPGVVVVVDIQGQYRLRTDTQPILVRSLLGDTTIEFTAGASPDNLPPNMRLRGEMPEDPMETVHRLEKQVSLTLASFEATSQEWRTVGQNVNSLMETERGEIGRVIEKAAVALDDFAETMQGAREMVASAQQLFADPVLRQKLHDTLGALPDLVHETRATIAAARITVERTGESLGKINLNLDQVQQATAPLAEGSRHLVSRLDGGLYELESLLTELHAFSRVLNEKEGSLQRFVSDPRLYENLARSTGALEVLLQNLEPTMRDLRIFSDKVARHPELLGVSGALSGSSGLKETPEATRTTSQPRSLPR